MSDPMSRYDVRPAGERDLPQLAAIENSGVELFESVLGDLTGDVLASPAPSGEERAAREGFLLVAGDDPVGFVHVAVLDGHAHLEQLSVVPAHGRQGIGGALLEAACAEAAERGFPAITLMTYADVAWNGRFYLGHGFTEVTDDQRRLGYQLVLEEKESALGLARHGRRVLMRRALITHRTSDELDAFLPALDRTPKDEGTVRLVVRRPGLGEREVLAVGELDPDVGLVGDTWLQRGSKRTADGSAHPDMQLNVVSHPLVQFLAKDPVREPLAGDQLYLDLDLSEANLPVWSELHFLGPDGDGADEGAVIQVTDQPHTGCGKFIERFGVDAMRFANGREGRPRRLRGLNARVVRSGLVRPGDTVLVRRPTE